MNLPGYDRWKLASPPEPEPRLCAWCGVEAAKHGEFCSPGCEEAADEQRIADERERRFDAEDEAFWQPVYRRAEP